MHRIQSNDHQGDRGKGDHSEAKVMRMTERESTSLSMNVNRGTTDINGSTWYRASVSGLNSLRQRRLGELPAPRSLDCSPDCRRLRLRRGCPPGASGNKAKPETQHRRGSKASEATHDDSFWQKGAKGIIVHLPGDPMQGPAPPYTSTASGEDSSPAAKVPRPLGP